MMPPNVNRLRSVLPANSRARSTVKGLVLFSIIFGLYLFSFFLCLTASYWLFRLGLGLMTGLMFSILFVLGHDACHDSLTAHKWLNAVLARLAFLPALHPYCTWELGHNRLHHGWTNLKGVDYVYTPFSKEEFDSLPRRRQLQERIYRTVWGAGFFYLIEIWWNHLIWPRPGDWSKLDKRVYFMDLSLVAGFLLLEISLTVFCSLPYSPVQLLFNLFCFVVLPYLVWNWLMAFITLQHHTNPNVAWFSSKEEWTFFNGQIRGTVHVKLPRLLEILFQNILEHTAHHVDPKIPLYNLPDCQKKLECEFKDSINIQSGSIFHFYKNLQFCQLYDYKQHQWLNFDGQPTTAPFLPNR
jgi:acyl-lipid omega-6 desaturase (Delta-12 desaturase)